MSGWDQSRKEANDAQAGGFLRLDDGESAKVVFLGEPYGFKQVWITSSGQSEIYDPNNPNHKGIRPSQRFKLHAFNTEQKELQVFEMSAQTLTEIDNAVNGERDKGGNVDPDVPGHGLNAVYKITRKGLKTKTKYSVNYIKDLGANQIEQMQAIELKSLAPQPNAPAASAEPVDIDEDDIPF